MKKKINRDLEKVVKSHKGWRIACYDNPNIPNHCILTFPKNNNISIDKNEVVSGNFSFYDLLGRLQDICEGKE